MKTFTEHAKAKKLPAAERDRIIKERNWTGEELLTVEEYEAIVAASTPEPEPEPEAAE